jgi:hypothetical protein
MGTPLSTTKLCIPQLRPNLVPRRRLTERLDEALHLGHRLLLICPPEGVRRSAGGGIHAGSENGRERSGKIGPVHLHNRST